MLPTTCPLASMFHPPVTRHRPAELVVMARPFSVRSSLKVRIASPLSKPLIVDSQVPSKLGGTAAATGVADWVAAPAVATLSAMVTVAVFGVPRRYELLLESVAITVSALSVLVSLIGVTVRVALVLPFGMVNDVPID